MSFVSFLILIRIDSFLNESNFDTGIIHVHVLYYKLEFQQCFWYRVSFCSVKY